MISNDKKAVVHIAKAQTGMSEVEYRDLLGSVGATSSTDLTQAGFKQMMKHFENMGFKQKKTKAPKAWKPVPSKTRLLGKIKAMRVDMGLSQRYVDAIARRMFSIDAAAWCDADQLRKIAAALMYKKKKG